MDSPKPQPPKIAEAPAASNPDPKPEFVRSPHLMQRPFRNDQLAALRETLPQNKRQNHKIVPKSKRQR